MKIIFGIFAGLAWLVSKMPQWMLNMLSYKLYVLLYIVAGYRRRVVNENLKKSFPELNRKQLDDIRREFYRHLFDVIVEVIKTPGLSDAEMKGRYHFKNPEVLNNLRKKNRCALILTGHLGNWEWVGPGLLLNFPGLDGYVVIKPLSNQYFDKYLNDMRCIYKSNVVIPFKQTLRYMIRNRNKVTYTLFAADQTPHKDEIHFASRFLNQQTPFFTGFEKLAKTLDQAVIFMDMYRTRRGYYEAVFYPITETPNQTSEFEITHQYIQLLEEAIRRRPHNWLWSHRRWKYADDIKLSDS